MSYINPTQTPDDWHPRAPVVAPALPLMTDDNQKPRVRGSITHKVKSWTMLFQAAQSGIKTHDIRLLDRDYQVGDFLCLQEYDWGAQKYTGRELTVEITYITCARVGDTNARACAFSPTCLHPDYGVLSIRKISIADGPRSLLDLGNG